MDCLPPKPIGLTQTQYTINAFNCHSPVSIKYIDKDLHCDPNLNDMETHEEIPYDILVHPSKQTFDGYYCSIIQSKFTIRCGIWSYNQVLGVPQTEIPLHIPMNQCQSMVLEKIYRAPNGEAVSLELGIENVVSLSIGGSMHAKDDKTNYCQGSDLQTSTGIIENR